MSVQIPSGYEIVRSRRAITGCEFYCVVCNGRAIIEVATYSTAVAFAIYHSHAQ